MNEVYSVVLIILGAFLTYSLYNIGETGVLQIDFISIILICVATVATIVVSAICNKAYKENGKRFAFSFLYSYLSFLILVVVGSIISGDFIETLMWLPVMIAIGIPFAMPLVVLVWLGTSLYMRNKELKS